MKKNLTELVFILDRSGSMQGLETDTVGGLNSMLEKQKILEGEVYVSTILFSNESQVLHDRLSIQQIKPLTDKDYMVGGCTALVDAIGGAVRHIGNIHKYARPEDVPEHTMFVITTDGLENASHRYTLEKVRQMIDHQKSKFGWEFLFLGANMDAVETAGQYGIAANRAANYYVTGEGMSLNYRVIGETISQVRCSKAVPDNWSEEIDEYFRKRGVWQSGVQSRIE